MNNKRKMEKKKKDGIGWPCKGQEAHRIQPTAA
jgi:hypothetical protein